MIRKVLTVGVLSLGLLMGGCANFSAKFNADIAAVQQAWQVATTTTVTPQAALVIANSFNVARDAATAYLTYCAQHLSDSSCSADNRRKVITAVRAGIKLRTQVEGYVSAKTTIPKALYDSFQSIVNTLANSPAANFGSK